MPDNPDYRCYLPNLFKQITQTLSDDWKDPIEMFIFTRMIDKQMAFAWETPAAGPNLLTMS